jgi:hypothetical protein
MGAADATCATLATAKAIDRKTLPQTARLMDATSKFEASCHPTTVESSQIVQLRHLD